MDSFLNNPLCLCGHSYKRHWSGTMSDTIYCIVRSEEGTAKGSNYVDECLYFKLDNLKYLEQKYKENNNV